MPGPIGSFIGIGIHPRVLSASAPDLGTVIVFFSAAMDPTSGVTTPASYSIPGTTVLGAVAGAGNTTAILTVSGLAATASYTVTVAQTLTDAAGNTLGVNVASFVAPHAINFQPAPAQGAPLFPSGDSQLDCGLEPFTQDEFLDLFRRIFPESYIAPLETGAMPGYELLQSFAQLWARISIGVERMKCSAQYLSASDGALATGTVLFSRPQPGPAVTMKAGTILVASQYNSIPFRTTVDVELALNAVGPVVAPVQAVFVGYEANLPGETTLSDGSVLPGAIDTFAMPFQDPAFADPSITIRQPTATTGGLPAALDQLGADRGIVRQHGEPSDRYRARIRSLPDSVSPAALKRVMTDLLQSIDHTLTFEFIECFEITYQTCYDAPASAIAGSSFDPNLFCYDDPRPVVPFRNRWLSEDDHFGGFIFVLPALEVIADFGMGYDDPATVPGDFLSSIGGRRAYAAYDIPDDFEGLAGCYDGYDANLAALYVGFQDLLTRLKAGGTSSAIEAQGD